MRINPDASWMMLIRVEGDGSDLDKPPETEEGWNASCHSRFERLLRETGIPTGLLCNDRSVRLIHAPPGESSGHITFDFSEMALPAGRPILSAFQMLLLADNLFQGRERRPPARAVAQEPGSPGRGLHPPLPAGVGRPLPAAPGICGRRPAKWRRQADQAGAGGPAAALQRTHHRIDAHGVHPVRRRPRS